MSNWLGVTGIIKVVGRRTTVASDRQKYFESLVEYFKNAPLEHEVFDDLNFEVTVIDDVSNRLDKHAQFESEAQNISLAFNASFRDLDIEDAELVKNWLNQYLSDNKTQSELDLLLVQGVFNLVSGFDTKTYVYADDLTQDETDLNQTWNEL